MILYLDTSALVKLFVEEEGSDKVKRAVSEARSVVTHAITYVEACAAFSKATHGLRDERRFFTFRGHLDAQWRSWEILPANDTLLRRAADLAAIHRLRAYDSVHLAAAESVLTTVEQGEAFRFGAFDGKLREVAERVGMRVLQ